ncbi:hypothetical protein [Streptomyces diastatochromogenes]|uniref:hypothetical protein n=1 Tax=Streptomyces diastatochromogenes TaxID=42236 RepID=UPI000B915AE6|nr:hypothetical protein [Streptomyces diastatochromogenes]MCZ0990926.1 hypothetical protein [Streptomyces diastatochromogenes]
MDPLPVESLVVDVDVVDEQGCAEISDRLEALRPHWLPRGVGCSTFGLATYLDVLASEDPEETYFGRLDRHNRMMRDHFGDLLDRVGEVLADLLKTPTRYDERVALPGFHVFEGEGIAIAPRPSQHFDLQYRALRWPFPIGPVEQAVSFTLPLALPRRGGALDVWDITEADIIRLERLGQTFETIDRTRPARRHEYQVGRMAVQLTPILHRIAAVPERYPDDRRITLQGHGIRDADGWVLYW